MAINNDFSPITFDEAKQKIIDFLRNSDEFKDYDFTGSRLNTLVDAWAYTVIYSGAYANAAVFEAFLQTARKRESIVLNAQSQGYIPASKRASTIEIETRLQYIGGLNPPPTAVVVPRGFKFFGQRGSDSYEFVATDDFEILGADGVYNGLVDAAQGSFVRNQYTWDTNTRIFIKDENIDRRFINLTVNGFDYRYAESGVRVASTDRVYYFRETVEGWTEIYFGTGEFEDIDGQIDLSAYVGGLRPSVGDTIVIEYLTTKGAEANFVEQFKSVDSITDYSITVSIAEGEQSQGGGDKEDKERVRILAPKVFEAQDRAVTGPDYETKIIDEFGSIVEAVRAWTQPGKTGYAFIAIKPVDALALAPSQVSEIESYLKRYNVSVVTPKIVTPTYIFIDHNIEVDYEVAALSITEDQLKQNIINSIDAYYTENVTNFSSGFHVSKLLPYIDGTDASILGSSCDVGVVKEFNIPTFWDLSSGVFMGDALDPRGIASKTFTFNEIDDEEIVRSFDLLIDSTDSGYMVMGPFPDESEAFVGQLYTLSDFDNKVVGSDDKWYKVGTVDYPAGTFYLDDFDDVPSNRWTQNAILDDTIKFSALINESDIYPEDGELITFEPTLRPEYITINFQPIIKE